MKQLEIKLKEIGGRNGRSVSKYLSLIFHHISCAKDNGYSLVQIHKKILNVTGDKGIAYQSILTSRNRNKKMMPAKINSIAEGYSIENIGNTIDTEGAIAILDEEIDSNPFK